MQKATYVDLVVRCDSEEDDLRKIAMWERTVGDTAYDLQPSSNNSEALRVPIVHETRDILSRHLWKLLLEQVFEARQDDHFGWCAVVIGNGKADETFALFGNSGLLWRGSLHDKAES